MFTPKWALNKTLYLIAVAFFFVTGASLPFIKERLISDSASMWDQFVYTFVTLVILSVACYLATVMIFGWGHLKGKYSEIRA